MEYFEKAVVGKVKRSLKSVDSLRNDCFRIFPNQGKWDGGSHPAFIVFCLPCKKKQNMWWKKDFAVNCIKYLFQVRQPIIGGALLQYKSRAPQTVVLVNNTWLLSDLFYFNKSSVRFNKRTPLWYWFKIQGSYPAITLWIEFLEFLAPTPRYFVENVSQPKMRLQRFKWNS